MGQTDFKSLNKNKIFGHTQRRSVSVPSFSVSDRTFVLGARMCMFHQMTFSAPGIGR